MSARTRELLEELKREAAKNNLKTASDLMALHKRDCGVCGRKGARPVEYCDPGWELAKDLATARSTWRQLTGPEEPDSRQGALW